MTDSWIVHFAKGVNEEKFSEKINHSLELTNLKSVATVVQSTVKIVIIVDQYFKGIEDVPVVAQIVERQCHEVSASHRDSQPRHTSLWKSHKILEGCGRPRTFFTQKLQSAWP